MRTMDSPVGRFFERYAALNRSEDTAAMVAQFAETFLAAGPQGAQCVKAADFALALPKRKQLFDSLGSAGTELVALEETALDARYTLARTRWRMHFVQGEQRSDVEVDSVFLVDTGVDSCRIVLYLANQDIFAVLKERGILKT